MNKLSLFVNLFFMITSWYYLMTTIVLSKKYTNDRIKFFTSLTIFNLYISHLSFDNMTLKYFIIQTTIFISSYSFLSVFIESLYANPIEVNTEYFENVNFSANSLIMVNATSSELVQLRKVEEKNGQGFYGWLAMNSVFVGPVVYHSMATTFMPLVIASPVGIAIAAGCIAVTTVGVLTYVLYERPPDKEKRELQQSEIENMNINSKALFNELQKKKNLNFKYLHETVFSKTKEQQNSEQKFDFNKYLIFLYFCHKLDVKIKKDNTNHDNIIFEDSNGERFESTFNIFFNPTLSDDALPNMIYYYIFVIQYVTEENTDTDIFRRLKSIIEVKNICESTVQNYIEYLTKKKSDNDDLDIIFTFMQFHKFFDYKLENLQVLLEKSKKTDCENINKYIKSVARNTKRLTDSTQENIKKDEAKEQ